MASAAAIYCRISEDREGSGLGVQRQESDCRALAERKGWSVTQVYIDNDVGAYGSKARPAYRQMLDALQAGSIDAVVVWHLDRLTRRPVELEEFFDVCDQAGVKDLASCTGDVDLSTHDGRFMARILGAVARKESDDKSRRTKRKHLELAQAGTPVGGTRPFGYDTDRITVRPDEAALVREAANRVLAGESLRALCMEWNTRDVPTPRGGRWTQTAIRRILTAPRTVGLRALSGEIIGPGIWEPLLDRATWERVRATLNARGAGRPFPTARRYLLTGFLRCGKCGTRLIARARTDRRRTYVCTSNPDKGGCGGIRVIADPLEEYVVHAAQEMLDSPAFRRQLQRPDEDFDVVAAIEADEAALAQLDHDYYVDQAMPRDRYQRVAGQLQDRLARLRRSLLAAAQVVDVGEGTSRQDWPALSLDRQRAILAACIDRIDIGPAVPGVNRFDPNRVSIHWRA